MYDHGQSKYSRDSGKGKSKSAAVAERRRMDRHLFTAAAEVAEITSGARFSTRTTDLSTGGCFVDTLSPFLVGTRVRVRAHREKQVFEALGTVVYSQTGLGMGIAFHNLPREQETLLEQWLNSSSASSQQPLTTEEIDGKKTTFAKGAERAVLARLVQLMISKGVISESEGTSIFNDSVLF